VAKDFDRIGRYCHGEWEGRVCGFLTIASALLWMTFYSMHLVEDENVPQPSKEIARRQDPKREWFRHELDDEICLEKINQMLAVMREEYWKVSRALQAYYNMKLRESGSEQRAYHTSSFTSVLT
jgi:hypothetical protein